MLKRVITGVVIGCILLPMLYFSATWLFVGFIALLSCVAMVEMIGCLGQKKRLIETLPAYLLAIGTPVLERLVKPQTFFTLSFVLFFFYMFYLLCISMLSNRHYDFDEAASLFTMTFYIVIGFDSILLIRDLEHGQYLFLLIFIGAFSTDIFAYFTGVLFGKHKLCPTISPKKTVEGAFGGVIFCILCFLLFGWITSKWFQITPNYLWIALGGLLTSILAQFGDLIFSSIKRKFAIKDFGNILPGHGGICDRFDSILAVAPILYMLTSMVPFLHLS